MLYVVCQLGLELTNDLITKLDQFLVNKWINAQLRTPASQVLLNRLDPRRPIHLTSFLVLLFGFFGFLDDYLRLVFFQLLGGNTLLAFKAVKFFFFTDFC